MVFAILIIMTAETQGRAETNDRLSLQKNMSFISYTPRSFSVINAKVQPATIKGIRDDLKLLRAHFDSIITYSCNNGLEHVPEIAEKLKYKSLIIGIWDPKSETEILNAVRLARSHPRLIAAISVGNEGIFAKKYTASDVEQTVLRLRKELPSVPLTTSEPFFLYLTPEYFRFFSTMDILLPIIHPMFEKWFNPADPVNAAAFVVNVSDKLQSRYQKPLIVKETGLPSGPVSKGFTRENQKAFWKEMLKQFIPSEKMALSFFEAFDAPWKPAVTKGNFPGFDYSQEEFWGFFTPDGKSKPVVDALRPGIQ